MAIARYSYRNPWQELDQLGSRLGRIFADEASTNGASWLPAVNVEETGDELVLTAEVPGMSPADIDIELENNVLTIRGEKKYAREENDDEKRHHLWERRYGSFERSFTLPRTVRGETISAEYENGILTVRMPKAAEAKSRKIPVGAVRDGMQQVGTNTEEKK